MSTVYQIFAATAAQAGNSAFLHIPAAATRAYAEGAVDLTYAEALSGIDELAVHYQRQGYAHPMRVALVLENRADFFLHWLALNSLGCSVIPISRDMQDDEIAYFLEHGEACLVVALAEARQHLAQLCAALDNPLPVVSCDDLATLPAAVTRGDDCTPGGNTECALLYTSGSTGKPKACILDNSYFIFAGEWYNALGGLAALRYGRERLLTPLPLTHMNAMAVSTMAMVMSAGCIVQLDRFHPREWWQTVRESDATIVHYLGVLPAILLELPEAADDDFSGRVRFGFGAGVNPKHHALFEQRFGFPLLEAWAMTESGVGGSIIANREPRHIGTCCFGKPPETLEYQLVDEHKQPVAPGQEGELRVRAAGADPRRGFFSGYLKNPEATTEAWLDGWLNTGDVVREGPDGSLHFVDRRKNVIRRSGENISALEVEAALISHPRIQQVVVTAVPDEIRGDEVAAVIIASGTDTGENDRQALADDITRHCLQQLAYYKAPGYILFCDTLPVTASNKPRRADIKALARERVSAGEALDTRSLKKRQPSQ
ncbi:ATP-dependent acyl-CoA ligase [Kineobactrum sediminis]|uniref:ATP-dependent acyl-CoA ligase n=1 Tax=Kineobactrum sediminis TaxID=1905677 RepID=A0A2N5Y1X3_9GAMM|nr:AMP-binding protein [Kineobactrum sediminis]PLW82395.1 ATP-dependent acyl-CoA ligase [Kineobactrum sediminis]